MSHARKGRRLPVSLPPRWPRWGALLLSTAVTATYLGILLFFVRGTDELVHRKWMVAVLCGSIGLLCAAYWVRDLVRWIIVGDTVVELSADPVRPGESVDYFILQTRDHSWIRQLEARAVCRRHEGRGLIEEVASLALGTAGPVDAQGRRAQFQGAIQIPSDAPASLETEPLKVRWSVEVRAFFGRRWSFVEEHPFIVKTDPPPATGVR